MNAQPHTQILRANDYAAALELAAAHPGRYIEVFVDAWGEVDRCRAHAADHGLAGRIGIHHRSALDALIEMKVLPGDDSDGRPGAARPGFSSRLQTFIRAAAFALASRFTVVSLR